MPPHRAAHRRVLACAVAVAVALGWWLAQGTLFGRSPGAEPLDEIEPDSLETLERNLLAQLARESRERHLPGLEIRSTGRGALRGRILGTIPGMGAKPLEHVEVLLLWHRDDRDRKLAKGAAVPAATEDAPRGDAAAEDGPALEAADPMRTRADRRVLVRTDEEGVFLIADLPTFVGGLLIVRHPPYREIVRRAIHVRTNELADLGDILLGAPTSLHGDVVDARGKTVAGARVQVFADGTHVENFDLRRGLLELQELATPLGEVATDGQGHFHLRDLPPGRYTLRISSTGRATAFRAGVIVSLDEQSNAVRVVLDDGAGFEGTVFDAAGLSVARARVIAVAIPQAGQVRIDRVETSTNDFGVYVLDSLVPGMRYFLEAAAPRHAPMGTFAVAGEGIERRDLTLRESGRVEGSIVSEDDGRPVPHAEVTMASGSLAGVSPLSTSTDANGQFVFEHANPGPVLLFLARAPGFVQTDVGGLQGVAGLLVESGRTLQIDRALAPGGLVAGRVTETNGRGIAYATVGIVERHARWRGERTAITDGEGRYEIGGIRAGEHEVRVAATGHAPLVADEDVRLDMPDPPVRLTRDIRLESGASIEGRVLDPEGAGVSGALVSLEAKGNRAARQRVAERTAVSHPDGTYRIYGIPAGLEIDVVAKHDAHGPGRAGPLRPIAGEAARVDVHMRGGISLLGRAEDPQGSPLEGARVRWGVFVPEEEWRLRDTMNSDGLLGARVLRTDAAGAFRIDGLAPGRHLIKVEYEGYSPWFRHDVAVPEQGQPAAVVAVLLPSLVVAGRVELDGGGAIGQAFVYAKETLAEGDPRVAEGRVRALVSAETDASGAFRLEGLAPGRYDIVVWHAPGAIAETVDRHDDRIRLVNQPAGRMNLIFRLRPITAIAPK